jgi:hypothetical protein
MKTSLLFVFSLMLPLASQAQLQISPDLYTHLQQIEQSMGEAGDYVSSATERILNDIILKQVIIDGLERANEFHEASGIYDTDFGYRATGAVSAAIVSARYLLPVLNATSDIAKGIVNAVTPGSRLSHRAITRELNWRLIQRRAALEFLVKDGGEATASAAKRATIAGLQQAIYQNQNLIRSHMASRPGLFYAAGRAGRILGRTTITLGAAAVVVAAGSQFAMVTIGRENSQALIDWLKEDVSNSIEVLFNQQVEVAANMSDAEIEDLIGQQ